MVFWLIILGMTGLSAAILLRVLSRTHAPAPVENSDLQVYRDQLAEVDRDLARGVVSPEDAERVRVEVSRRILAADAAKRERPTARGSVLIWALVTVLGLGAGIGLYWSMGAPGYPDMPLKARFAMAEKLRATRPSQAAAEQDFLKAVPPVEIDPSSEYIGLVEQLRQVVAERPDDQQGLRLLAVSERNLGNHTAAHEAFAKYLKLRREAVTAEDLSSYAEFLIRATGGYVSPEAEAVLDEALRRNPNLGNARYFWGLMEAQTGRPDKAFHIWDGLLRAGPADAPWVPLIQGRIEELARLAGVTYTMPTPGSAARGPNQDDVEAAGQMSAAERMQMIEGMVASLSDRLATEGGTVQEWAQLITALGVLGRHDQAFAIFGEAQTRFAADKSALDILQRAGEQAGVAN